MISVVVPPPSTGFRVTANEAQGCVITGDVLSLGCLAQIISNVVSVALTFLGLTTLVFLIIGAVKYVTSSGDPKAIQTAQKTMTFAIIGAVIVLGSFILINVITTALSLPNPVVNFSIFQ